MNVLNILRLTFCLFLISIFSSSVYAAKAPDFMLFDQNQQPVTLKDYRGKGLIIHFWGTWCPYCKKFQPGLEMLYRKYKQSGLEVLAISIKEPLGATPHQVLAQLGVTFKTVLDGDKVAKIYNIAGTPASYFINRQGDLVWKTNTSNAFDPKIEAYIRKILHLDQ